MGKEPRHAGNLKRVGGRLCLDFINTVDWRGREEPVEFLNSYGDLLAWAEHGGILTAKQVRKLSTESDKKPDQARKVLHRAVAVRESLYRIFSNRADGTAPAREDLDRFNRALVRTMSHSRIVMKRDRFIWETVGYETDLEGVLRPIIRSAAELLVSEDLKRVKKCMDSACGWLFLDTSRNRSRRWCNMSDCGNRAKASRFYWKGKPNE